MNEVKVGRENFKIERETVQHAAHGLVEAFWRSRRWLQWLGWLREPQLPPLWSRLADRSLPITEMSS